MRKFCAEKDRCSPLSSGHLGSVDDVVDVHECAVLDTFVDVDEIPRVELAQSVCIVPHISHAYKELWRSSDHGAPGLVGVDFQDR